MTELPRMRLNFLPARGRENRPGRPAGRCGPRRWLSHELRVVRRVCVRPEAHSSGHFLATAFAAATKGSEFPRAKPGARLQSSPSRATHGPTPDSCGAVPGSCGAAPASGAGLSRDVCLWQCGSRETLVRREWRGAARRPVPVERRPLRAPGSRETFAYGRVALAKRLFVANGAEPRDAWLGCARRRAVQSSPGLCPGKRASLCRGREGGRHKCRRLSRQARSVRKPVPPATPGPPEAPGRSLSPWAE